MGREATCHCKWGVEEGDCKVLLESSELILRSGLRRRIPLSAMAGVAARGSNLVFHVGQDDVELGLGPEAAQRWAKAITSPPPTLAGKMGISRTTRLSVIGDVTSEELKAAIAEASPARGREVDLMLVCVNSQLEVDLTLHPCLADKTCCGTLWVIYPKGASSGVKESTVRELLRSHGFIDTKVASVSARLTTLRFVKRKSNS